MFKFTLRINDMILYRKFQAIAEYNQRSMNSELIIAMRERVVQYEKRNGKITPEDLNIMDTGE